MTPVEALTSAINLVTWWSDTDKRWPGPGALIERLPRENRDALSRLTSADLERLMPYCFHGKNWFARTDWTSQEKISQAKMAYDREVGWVR